MPSYVFFLPVCLHSAEGPPECLFAERRGRFWLLRFPTEHESGEGEERRQKKFERRREEKRTKRHNNQLPSETSKMAWQRIRDPATGQAYYYNDENQVTQWEFPENVLDTALGEHGWDKATTESNGVAKMYFFSVDGESLWEVPTPVLAQLRGLFGDDLSQDEIKGESVERGSSTDVERTAENEEEGANGGDVVAHAVDAVDATIDEMHQKSPAAGDESELSDEVGKSVPPVNQLIGLEELVASEEGKDVDMEMEVKLSEGNPDDAFLAMLRECEIGSDCTYTDVVRKCSKDPRYWRVRDPIQRSRIFEVYLVKKADEDFAASKEKYRQEFYGLLAKHNVKYYTRWTTCSRSLQEEKLCSVLSERIKREFFDEYTTELRREKEAASKELKAKESTSLEEEFLANVTISSEFAKIVSGLEERYKNLTKGEMLSIFEKVIAEREREQVAVVDAERRKNFRADRRARAAFKEMLAGLVERKEFVPTSRTRWFEFVTLLKDRAEFTELAGHHGSSAIDYYWDLIDGAYGALASRQQLVRQQLVNSNRKIGDVGEDEFVQLMAGSSKTEVSSLCEDDLRTLYAIIRGNAKAPTMGASTSGAKRSAPAEAAESSAEKRQRIMLRTNNV